MTLDIKLQKRWKYEDTTCVGCGEREESGDEVLTCEGFSDGKVGKDGKVRKDGKLYSYIGFFYGSPSEMAEMALVLQKRLKKIKRILDEKMEEEN